jgi:hypothetical protein
VTLVRPLSATAWELRTAWATRRRVAVSLERADLERVEGYVFAVAATGVSATIAGIVIPLDRILAVHHPSLLGDATGRGGSYDGPARREPMAGQAEIPGVHA